MMISRTTWPMTSDETQFSLEDWNVRSLLVRPCVLAMTLLAVAGCGQNCQRVSVDGNVTLDGKPLAEGAINFIPQLGTAGPTAGAAITEGRFSIERDRGTFTGMFRVEITATRKTGRQKRGPLGNMV